MNKKFSKLLIFYFEDENQTSKSTLKEGTG